MTVSQDVHVILLYHPLCDVRHASAVAVTTAILRRLAQLYIVQQDLTTRVLVGQIRYGFCPSDDEDSKTGQTRSSHSAAAAAAKLSSRPLQPINTVIENLQQHASSGGVGMAGPSRRSLFRESEDDIFAARSEVDWLEQLEADINGSKDASSQGKACISDALVAAIEMFGRHSVTYAPLSRYIIHIFPPSFGGLRVADDALPHCNLDSCHDDWTWKRAAAHLGRMAVWPSSVACTDAEGAPPPSVAEGDQIRKAIADKLPSTLPYVIDSPTVLGSSFRLASTSFSTQLSGLSDAAATTARAAASANIRFTGKRRGRQSSFSADVVMSSEGPAQDAAAAAPNGQAGFASEAVKVIPPQASDADRQALQKVLFLQQQQQMMLRNVKILKDQDGAEGAINKSPSRSRLLDQLREQLIAQQTALQSHYANISANGSGSLTTNLNDSLQALMLIDKEANKKGINLGGPSALALRNRQQQLAAAAAATKLQSTQQPVKEEAQASTNLAATSSAAGSTSSAAAVNNAPPILDASAAAAQQARRPGAPAIWAGAITWSLTLANKQRNPAATFVTALCAPNTKPEDLMLPWPQRLAITDTHVASLSLLQHYVTSNAIPCIMFNPRPLPATGADGMPNTPLNNQNNETMYTMLARMIHGLHGCAFIKMQGGANATPDAGIVIVPMAATGGSGARRLLGLVFRQAVPWHLFMPSGAGKVGFGAADAQIVASSMAQGATSTPAQSGVGVGGGSRPSVAGMQTPQPLFKQQQQNVTPQQQHVQPIQGQAMNLLATQQPTQIVNPLPSALGNLSALSAAQLQQQQAQQQQQQQQVPQWSGQNVIRPTQSTNFMPTNVPQNPNAGLGNALPASFGNAFANVDFGALAAQLNLNPANRAATSDNGVQATPGQAQQTLFNQVIWNNNGNVAGNANQPAQQQQAANQPQRFNNPPAGPSTADLEALQRLLGLNG